MESLLRKVFDELKHLKKVKNQTDFGNKMDYGKSYVSLLFQQDPPVSELVKKKLVNVFGISKNWLDTEGKCDTDIFGNPLNGDAGSVPFIAAGFTDVFKPVAPVSQNKIDVGDMLKDSDAAFIVHEKGMEPTFPPGCLLGLKQNHDSFIQPGEAYLLLTKSSSVFRRVYYTEDRSSYLCVSDNFARYEDGHMTGQLIHPAFEVKAAEVLCLYDVTGMTMRSRNSAIMGYSNGPYN